jgi:hypothetical protein
MFVLWRRLQRLSIWGDSALLRHFYLYIVKLYIP